MAGAGSRGWQRDPVAFDLAQERLLQPFLHSPGSDRVGETLCAAASALMDSSFFGARRRRGGEMDVADCVSRPRKLALARCPQGGQANPVRFNRC